MSRSSLLVFDGDCAFCTSWVNRLQACLPAFPEAQPHQWLDLKALGLTAADVRDYAWLITRDAAYRGHLALSVLLRGQPGLVLRFAGWILATPPFSWAAAITYRLVSRFRHRLPGGTPACAMPRPGA